jgi:hypothetical protein
MTAWMLTALTIAMLTVATSGALLLRSELRLHRARVARYGVRVADGPQLGHPLPRPVLQAVGPQVRAEFQRLLFISGSCEPCRDVVVGLAQLSPSTRLRLAVIVSGVVDPAMDEALRSLRPGRVATGGAAHEAHLAALVRLTPFGVLAEGEVVVAKGYLSPDEDSDWFVADRTTTQSVQRTGAAA